MKFIEYFNENIVTSGKPSIDYVASNCFEIIINVNDQFDEHLQQCCLEENFSYFWFPMNEHSTKGDIGLNSIFGALQILKLAYKQNKKVLIHCAAGANRSVTVSEAFYFMYTGKHLEKEFSSDIEDMFIMNEEQKKDYKDYIKMIRNNQLLANCYEGNLPSRPRMESFLKKLKDYDLNNNCLDELKINTFTS